MNGASARLSHGRSADTRCAMVFRGPASSSAVTSRTEYITYEMSVSHRSKVLLGANKSNCPVSNVHNIKFCKFSFFFYFLHLFVHLKFSLLHVISKLLKRGISSTSKRLLKSNLQYALFFLFLAFLSLFISCFFAFYPVSLFSVAQDKS